MHCEYTYICFLSSVSYLPGLKVLYKSLIKTNPKYPFSVVIIEDIFEETYKMVKKISKNINVLKEKNIELPFTDFEKGSYWKNTFFKLKVGNLTQFKKVVMLDLDLLILNNIDSLFEWPHLSAVVSDKIRYPNKLFYNSGVMVIEPSIDFYSLLLKCLKEKRKIEDRYSYGDQEIFYLSDPQWPSKNHLHLPEQFNESYNSAALLAKKLPNKWKDIKILHFWGQIKPWEYNDISIIIWYIKRILKLRFDLIKVMRLYRSFL